MSEGTRPKGLPCPRCGHKPMTVFKTREGDGAIRRRRKCGNPKCDLRLWTREEIERVG